MRNDVDEITDSFREIINIIKDQSMYNKSIDLSSDKTLTKDFYEGQQGAYFHIMDAIIGYVKEDENLSLESLGLDDFNIIDILNVLSSEN